MTGDAFSPSWLVEALVASTVLMVAVLLLRRPARKAFGAEVAYALWLLPVLRLALPPLPAAWHEATVAPVLRATEQMTVLLVDQPVAETAAAVPSFTWLVPALASLWLAGAGAFVVWHSLAHHRFCRRMLDHAASSEERDGVRVIETSAASGPLAFGIWRRYVAFPRDFAERYEPEERDLALAHELGHHARGDLIANWVALFVLALHWFNPIAWRAFRAFRADQEIANDARVLAGLNPMRRHTYACAILKAAHGGSVSAACHLHTIDDLKGRLRMLTTTRTSRARLLTGAGALSVFVAAGLGLTASGTAVAAKMRHTVEHATGVDLARLDQAMADAAPVADPAPVATAVAGGPVAVAIPPSTATVAPAHVHEHVVASDVPGPGLPPSPPAVSAPPAAPVGPELAVPPAPPVPLAPLRGAHSTSRTVTVTTDKQGKRVVHYSRYVRLDRDGKPVFVEETHALPPVPNVVSRSCGKGGADARMVLREQGNAGQRIIVCTDRIATAAARGAAIAANSKDMERHAYLHALENLRASRVRMMASDDMTGAQLKAALAGLDTAIAELEGDLARAR